MPERVLLVVRTRVAGVAGGVLVGAAQHTGVHPLDRLAHRAGPAQVISEHLFEGASTRTRSARSLVVLKSRATQTVDVHRCIGHTRLAVGSTLVCEVVSDAILTRATLHTRAVLQVKSRPTHIHSLS